MNKLTVLSLFDGISSGQIALNRAGIEYDTYYASEIDKHAIKVTQSNYPNTIQLGDVTKVFGKDLPKIDMLLAGSPCQGFSCAGKGLNFNDPRSKLFFEFVRLLKECQPTYFLLENVSMKKEYQDIISSYVGVQPFCINSSLLSAQSRKRWYWTNIPNVIPPIDKNILLKDIIEQDYKGIWVYPRAVNKGGIKSYKGKSPSLTTSSWQHNFLIAQSADKGGSITPYLGAAKRTWPRYPNGQPRSKRLELRKDEKANCLTSVSDDSLLVEKPLQIGIINNGSQGYRIYSTQGKSPTLLANSGGNAGKGNALISDDGIRYRKFTRTEAERLQTVTEGYTNSISESQAFKCLGNGWTVDVIAHILSFIPK